MGRRGKGCVGNHRNALASHLKSGKCCRNSLGLKSPSALALRPGWPVHLSWLALTALAILLSFASDAMGMADIWWNASTFGHCLLIPFILFWLVQQRDRKSTRLNSSH